MYFSLKKYIDPNPVPVLVQRNRMYFVYFFSGRSLYFLIFFEEYRYKKYIKYTDITESLQPCRLQAMYF